MPANTKYLSNGWTRFSKVVAAILGAYLAAAALHMGLANVAADDTPVLLTATYSMFFLWCGLMVLVYLIKKAWVAWGILLLLTGVGSLLLMV